MRRPIVVPLIILINVGVFLLWIRGGERNEAFMEANFVVSWQALVEGRYWTLLTSVFSHNLFLHIFVNMFVLNSFGPFLEQILGRVRFLRFYLVAGILSSLSHAVLSNYLMHKPDMGAVGASGALAGMIWVFALIFPREKILLMGIIPLPAILGALAFVGLDLWGLFAQVQGGGLPIGHGAHLGGSLAGMLYYFFFLRGRYRVERD